MTPEPVILFDGPCSLCQRSVRFILRHEKNQRLRFASLQSDTGRNLLQKYALPDEPDSMVFIEEGEAYTESDAAFRIAGYLRKPWGLLSGFRRLPGILHRPCYRWIARHRYRWFGKDDTCPLPAPDQAERFLS